MVNSWSPNELKRREEEEEDAERRKRALEVLNRLMHPNRSPNPWEAAAKYAPGLAGTAPANDMGPAPWEQGDILIGGGPRREVTIPRVAPPKNDSILFTGRRLPDLPAEAYDGPLSQPSAEPAPPATRRRQPLPGGPLRETSARAPSVAPVDHDPSSFDSFDFTPIVPPASLPQLGGSDEEETPREGPNAGYWGSVVSGLASDTEEMRRYLAMNLFPNLPLKQALKRIEFRDDTFVYRAKDGHLYYALPRGSVSTFLKASNEVALPLAGGGIGAGLTWRRGTKVAYAATMTGAAIGEIVRQVAGDRALGEAASPGLNWGEVIKKAGGGAFGRMIATRARDMFESVGWQLPEIPPPLPHR